MDLFSCRSSVNCRGGGTSSERKSQSVNRRRSKQKEKEEEEKNTRQPNFRIEKKRTEGKNPTDCCVKRNQPPDCVKMDRMDVKVRKRVVGIKMTMKNGVEEKQNKSKCGCQIEREEETNEWGKMVD